MLKKLIIHQFRHVKPGVELAFNDGFNVLLGRNGTGKTTLLDLISLVLRCDFSRLHDEEFDLEFEVEHEHGTMRMRARRERVNAPNGPEAVPGQGNGPPRTRRSRPMLAASFVLTRFPTERSFEIEAEPSKLRWRANGDPWTEDVPIELFSVSLLTDLVGELQWRPAVVAEVCAILSGLHQDARDAYRFDESLDAWRAITSDANHDDDELAQPPRLEAWVRYPAAARYDTTTSSFMPLALRIEEPVAGRTQSSVDLRGTRLERFTELTGLTGLAMSVAVSGSISGSQRTDSGVWWRFGRAEFLLTNAGGATFSHRALSYGQKRLLAFLYYREANHRYVIADELVNGMHHEWIRFCLDELDTNTLPTQSFLTSQNPLLLDYIPIGTVEDARRTFIQCRTAVIDGHARFVWSNVSSDDASELFADHTVGIQHLGELLRVKGLW